MHIAQDSELWDSKSHDMIFWDVHEHLTRASTKVNGRPVQGSSRLRFGAPNEDRLRRHEVHPFTTHFQKLWEYLIFLDVCKKCVGHTKRIKPILEHRCPLQVAIVLQVLSCAIMRYHVLSCAIMRYHALSCAIMRYQCYHVLSRAILRYHALYCAIMCYHALSCAIVRYHVLSCAIMPVTASERLTRTVTSAHDPESEVHKNTLWCALMRMDAFSRANHPILQRTKNI